MIVNVSEVTYSKLNGIKSAKINYLINMHRTYWNAWEITFHMERDNLGMIIRSQKNIYYF